MDGSKFHIRFSSLVKSEQSESNPDCSDFDSARLRCFHVYFAA